MITYTDMLATMAPNIDAEWSERYLPEQDYIPAINSAVSKAMTAIGWAMANRDGSEEALRDSTFTRIFQTNSQGGVAISDPTLVAALGHGMWNVLAVYAEPFTVEQQSIQPQPPYTSVWRDDLAWSGTGSRVERVTLEEVPLIRNNGFTLGNEVWAANPKRRSYSYYIVGNAATAGYPSGGGELRVLPQSITSSALIGISYIAEPIELTPANYLTAQLPLPQSFKRTLADWALGYIAIKQGDQTVLKTTIEQDASMLFQMTV
jgi:hypothetical protein